MKNFLFSLGLISSQLFAYQISNNITLSQEIKNNKVIIKYQKIIKNQNQKTILEEIKNVINNNQCKDIKYSINKKRNNYIGKVNYSCIYNIDDNITLPKDTNIISMKNYIEKDKKDKIIEKLKKETLFNINEEVKKFSKVLNKSCYISNINYSNSNYYISTFKRLMPNIVKEKYLPKIKDSSNINIKVFYTIKCN